MRLLVPAHTLALLHTTAVTVPMFRELAAEPLSGARAADLLDDSLLADVVAAGHVTAAVQARLRACIEQAAVLGASAILSCCSSIGEAMEGLAPSARLTSPISGLRMARGRLEGVS